MSQFQPCPKCQSTGGQKVSFSWWGGLLGPKLFNHVKCNQCGEGYNGKTGKSNALAIAIYLGVSVVLVVVVLAFTLFNK